MNKTCLCWKGAVLKKCCELSGTQLRETLFDSHANKAHQLLLLSDRHSLKIGRLLVYPKNHGLHKSKLSCPCHDLYISSKERVKFITGLIY